MALKDTLKLIRRSMFYEQPAFAKIIGVSIGSICHYESGTRKPRLPILKRYLDLAREHDIKINLEEFFE